MHATHAGTGAGFAQSSVHWGLSFLCQHDMVWSLGPVLCQHDWTWCGHWARSCASTTWCGRDTTTWLVLQSSVPCYMLVHATVRVRMADKVPLTSSCGFASDESKCGKTGLAPSIVE